MAINSVETIPTPRPPSRLQVENIDSPQDINKALNSIYDYAKDVANYNDELYNILHSGALVRSFQVEELLASTIGAGTIAVDQIYLGSDKFELDGSLSQIRVKDDAGVVMLEFGEFASGTDWGIKVRNGSNAVVFQALSNAGVTMDGAIITNATIVDAQIVDVAGNKLTGSGFISEGDVAANAITATKISVSNLAAISADFGTITAGTINATVAINAGAINAGTLTVDGNPAISVTGSGACVFESGGDIIMKASGSGDDNLIQFRNSSNTAKGDIGYNSTTDDFYIQSRSAGCDLALVSGSGTIQLGDNTEPFFDGGIDLGGSSKRWRHIYTDDITSTNALVVGDIKLGGGKGYIITEPDKVYKDKKASDGVMFMSNDWEVMMYYEHKTKTLKVNGSIESDCVFPTPDIQAGQRLDT